MKSGRGDPVVREERGVNPIGTGIHASTYLSCSGPELSRALAARTETG